MMMVNQINNNSVPWPTTIPDQMPWLNPSAGQASIPMQFVGQQAYSPEMISSIASTNQPHPQLSHIDTCSPVVPPVSMGQPPINVPDTMIHNPFYPQQAGGQQFPQLAPVLDGSPDITQAPHMVPGSSLNRLPHHQLPAGLSNIGSSLTQIPPSLPTFEPTYQASSHKRSSFEMEDELTTEEAPPTKQQLSENKLFQRFGSLHLDNDLYHGNAAAATDIVECDSIDSDDELPSAPTTSQAIGANDRKEFDRYVYLLFKGKKSDGQFPVATANAVERLIREEREKLSKAVILWNPPPRNPFADEEADSSDDDQKFSYKDHKDFLKDSQSSVVITEVTEDTPILELNSVEPDDVMLE